MQGRIAADLRGGVTVTPHITLAAPIRVQLDAIVCSGGAEIKPQVDFSIPLNLDFDPLAGGFGDGCIKLNAILSYYVRCFGFTLFNGTKNLAEKTWGWSPKILLPQVLDEIAKHAEQHPNWLDVSNS